MMTNFDQTTPASPGVAYAAGAVKALSGSEGAIGDVHFRSSADAQQCEFKTTLITGIENFR
jgi:hypothetical protein